MGSPTRELVRPRTQRLRAPSEPLARRALPRSNTPRRKLWLRAAQRAASRVCLFGSLSWACDPFHTEFAPIEPARVYRADRSVRLPQPKQSLVVMTYNIKFGGGRIDFFFDCHGDRVLMTEAEVRHNIDQIAAKIRQVDPDVVFLQEVDINSKRSAFVDELQLLLDQTQLGFAVYASQWRADFVPSDGLGPVESGNAIASKYPLHDGTRIALPLRSDQSGLERYFYLRRNLLTATLDEAALGAPLYLVATHTAAYSQDGTKLRHIEHFERALSKAASRGLALGGGDLNTLPPGSSQRSGFADSACEGEFEADDYSEEGTWLDTLYEQFNSAIPLADYQADNSSYFTHTTDGRGFWNRKLDYLFSNAPLSDGLVHQSFERGGMSTMPLSDHAPVTATLHVSAGQTDGGALASPRLDAGARP